MSILSNQEVRHQIASPWELSDGQLHAVFKTGDFANGLAFVNSIGRVAEEANHHPDVLLTYGAVEVWLSSHEAGGITDLDITLSREFTSLFKK